MEAIVIHPDLQGLRRFVLVTRDAGNIGATHLLTQCTDFARIWDVV
jgi:hypothetical protein